ncbi:MAG: (Fe-S)-binding protein [Desulfobacterales bacterium]|nr:(Fe-S)-binding protein [Desulfobacterales bacterium]
MPKPGIIEILKLRPKTNCRDCGEPTCMVFATKVAEGAKRPEDCFGLGTSLREELSWYITQFNLDY